MADPLAGLFDRPSAPALSNFLKQKFNAAGQRVSIFDDSIGDTSGLTPPEPSESLIERAKRYGGDTLNAVGAPARGIAMLTDVARHGGIEGSGISLPEGDRGNPLSDVFEPKTRYESVGTQAANALLPEDQARGSYAKSIGREALRFGGDIAADPLTYLGLGEGTIGKAAGAAFTGLMGKGALDSGTEAYQRIKRDGFTPEVAGDVTRGILEGTGAVLGASHFLHRTPTIADANALHTEAPLPETGTSVPSVGMAAGPPQPPQAQPVDATFQQASAPPPPPPAPVKGVDLTSEELARVQQAQVIQQQQAAQAQAVVAAQAQQQAAIAPPPATAPVQEPALSTPPVPTPPVDNIQARDTAEVGRLTRMLPQLREPDLATRLAFYEKKGLAQSADAVRAEIQNRQPQPPAPEPIPLHTPEIAPGATQTIPAAVAPPEHEIAPPAQELAVPAIVRQGEALANPAERRSEPEIRENVQKYIEDNPAATREDLAGEIKRLRSENAANSEQAVTDPVTGLANHRGWQKVLETVHPENDHVLVADLSGFKDVNDLIGHVAGNEVLGRVGGLLKKHFGEETARDGGDEFQAVLRGTTPEDAQARAEAFRADLRELRLTVRNRVTGKVLDIPGFEAHIGVGRDAELADVQANLDRERTGSGRGGPNAITERAPESLSGSEPAVAGPPGPRLGDRSQQLAAPSNPADFEHLNNHAAIDREVDAAIPSAITALSHGSHEPGGKVFQGTEHLTTLAPGMHPAKVEYGLEDLPEGAKTIANALQRDKNNPLEMRAKAAMAARFTEDLATRGDAHEPVGGDTSFNPDELETAGAKYAVTQKTKAGEQHVIPGSLDGSLNQALRPEGREGDGPLFKQEEEARLQKEKESQGRLFRAAPEGEARPGTGLSLEDVRKHVNAKDITETPEGFQFKVGPTGVRIDRVGDIHLEPQAFEAGRPGQDIEGMQAVGSYQRVGDLANIKLLAKVGETPRTLLHEVFHLVKDLGLLKPGEQRAIDRKFGAGEEGQADAYADWNPSKTPNTLFSKIRSFFNGIYRAFRPSWESAFENVRSGKAFERSGNEAVPQGAEQFATAPKLIEEPLRAKPIPPANAPPEALDHGDGEEAPSQRLTLPEASLVDKVASYFQDRLRRLDVVEKSVGAQGGKVAPAGEGLKAAADALGSKGAAKLEDIQQKYVDPLVETLSKAKAPLKDLDDYLAILHAPDRDAVIAKRTEGKVTNGSGWTEQERTQRMTELQKKYGGGPEGRISALEPAAKIVRDMREEQLRILQDGGLLSKEQAQGWKDTMGEHYVPLRTAEVDAGVGTGRGFDIRGRETKTATGRSTKADSPVTFMLQQLQRAAIRAEKNKVDQKFADFVRENNLFDMDKEHQRTELDAKGQVSTARDTLRDTKDFTYKVNGETHRIDIASTDPLLDKAMTNASTGERNVVVDKLGAVSRHFSKAVTSWNPAFMFTNFARDIQEATANVAVEHGPKVAKGILQGIAPAMREMYQMSKDSTKASQMAREFKADGGAVGWYSVDSIENLQKDLTSRIAAAGPGTVATAKRIFQRVGKSVTDINGTVENATRFATYKALREAGASREKAANVARNATLDFTKRGEASPTINALYTFFNANVQGAKRFKEVLVDSPKGRALAGGIVAAGMALDAYNRANAGDSNNDGTNDYDDIPEYVKSRNWVFMRGEGKKPVLVPIPYGFSVLHTAGRQIMSAFAGATTPGKAAMGIVGAGMNAFNPLGNGDFTQMLAPTFLDPFVQHATNRNWNGAPLKPESYPNAPKKPESEQYFKNAPPAAIAIAKFLNDHTGGDKVTPGYISVSPEILSLYADAANSMFGVGGWAKNAIQATETAKSLSSGEAPELRNIPVANRFLYEEKPGATGQKYRANLEDLDTLYSRYKTYRQEGDLDKARALPVDLIRAKGAIDGIDTAIRGLQRRAKLGADVDARIEALQTRANRIVATARRNAGLPSEIS